MIEIHPYGPQWEQAHIAFASKYWTKSRRKIPEYIYWKFRGQPTTEITSFLLAIENNEVIGQLGLIPVNLVIEGNVYDSQWACDLMVDTSYRGKNVAKLLYEVAHNQKTITIGSDPSPAASKSMQKNGYQLLPSFWRFIFPMNLNQVTTLKGFDSNFLKKIPNPFLLLVVLRNIFHKNTFRTVDLSNLLLHPLQEYKSQLVFVARDIEFAKWRFGSFKNYYKGAEFRLNNQQHFYSGYFTNDTYYLMDYWIKNRLDFFLILGDIINRYKNSGLKAIRFFGLDEKLFCLGCLKFRTRSEIIYYTNSTEIKQKINSKVFYYTYADSDENI